MDNNDSMKSQQTGGLKLMTVFIAVLALHVVVIGGFTVYHLMSGGNTDADLATTDKTHKAITDGAMPDASSSDKSSAGTSSAAPSETAAVPAATTTPETDQAAPTPATTTPATTLQPTSAPAASSVTASAPTPAPAIAPAPVPAPALVPAPTLTLNAPKPLQLAPPAQVADASQATGPLQPSLAPPPDMAPTPAPLTSLAAGPVHMPPAASSAAAVQKPERERGEHEHQQIYVVKITDSYKKIAKAHHVTVVQLKEANHIKGDTLHTGQKLIIPSEKKYVAENMNASASTLSSAPASPVLSDSVAPMTTGLTSASSTVADTGLHHHLYTIAKGDTLLKIAHKFKTTPSAIIAENSIANPAKLTIGKKLKIPPKESRSAKVAEPVATPQPSQVEAKEKYKPTTPSGQLANFTP